MITQKMCAFVTSQCLWQRKGGRTEGGDPQTLILALIAQINSGIFIYYPFKLHNLEVS